MTEELRAAKEALAHADLIINLREQERFLEELMLKTTWVPGGWERIEDDNPVRRKKTKVTAAFDADMVRWFRSMGHGCQGRMNAVLRAYMQAIICKHIMSNRDQVLENRRSLGVKVKKLDWREIMES